MRFTKGLKKFLSLALTSALVVTGANVVPGLQDEAAKTAKAAGKVAYNGAITSWNTGGDADCRLQILNTWGEHDKLANGDTDLTDTLMSAEWTDLEVTFTVSGVKETLAEAGLEKATAAIAMNTSNGWDANIAAEADQKKDITEDGTYTFKFSVDPEETDGAVTLANYLAIRFEDLDKLAVQKGIDDKYTKVGSLQFSDVKLKMADNSGVKVVFDNPITSWNTGGDADCRLQVLNTWGEHDKIMNGETDLTDAAMGAEWTDLELTFTVAGVKETLEEAGLEKATAAIAMNTSNGWDANIADDADQKKDITEDGTYTFRFSVDPEETDGAVTLANYLAIRFEDLDKLAVQKGIDDKYTKVGSLQFSNVRLVMTTDAEEEPTPTVAPTTAPTAAPSEAPSTEYHAYLAFQTDQWAFRELWTNEDNGRKSKDIKYSSQIGQYRGKTYYYDATIQDAVIDHNGEYTVSISGVDISALTGEKGEVPTKYNWMQLSTDLEKKTAGLEKIKISNVSLTVDDKTVTYKNALNVINDGTEDATYYRFGLINDVKGWNGDVACEYTSNDVGLAKQKIEVKFTVSGGDFSYKTIGTAKGKTFTSGNFKYKVTTASQKNTAGKIKTGKVALAGLSAKGKKAKSLTLPVTVKSGEASYTVTALNAGAFKGAKATKITLNKNIKKLPKNAFASCKKLTKITFKKKLTSVNKAAFKGCKKTIKIAGTSAKANLKLIKKKASYKKFK